MSNIGKLGNPQQVQQLQQTEAPKQTKAETANVIANDPALIKDVHETKQKTTSLVGGAQPLSPPSVPQNQMTADLAEGAASFGSSLHHVGSRPMRSGDGLLVAFLKLQLLAGDQDNRAQNLSEMGRRTLRDSSHGEGGMSNVFYAAANRAGTEGLGSALSSEAEMMNARNALLALLSGDRPDQEGRAEASVEADRHRNEIAKLVLDLVDRHNDTKVASAPVRL